MLDFGTSKCSASIFITAEFAAPSAGAAVVCTRKVPSASTVTPFLRARGITRTLKVRLESFITHNMQMEMKNALSSTSTRICNSAEIITQSQRINRFTHRRPETGL